MAVITKATLEVIAEALRESKPKEPLQQTGQEEYKYFLETWVYQDRILQWKDTVMKMRNKLAANNPNFKTAKFLKAAWYDG